MSMTTMRILLIAFSLLPLSACYDFDFPLDPVPRVPVDGRLVGVWRCLAMEQGVEEPLVTLAISRRTEHVTHWRFGPDPRRDSEDREDAAEDLGEYDVHGSTVKGGQLLSAQETKPDGSGSWSFVRYTFLLPGVLRLQLIEDEPFKSVEKDSAALRKEVQKRREDPAIYSDFLICNRAKPPESPSPSPTPGL